MKAVDPRYQDPMDKVNRAELPLDEGVVGCSHLGSFTLNGWSIRISPALTEREWAALQYRSPETWLQWGDGHGEYNVGLAFNLLREMFPSTRCRP